MDTLKAILSRHSYRGKYLDNPVPRYDLKKIMEAGLAAPSGCNKHTTSLIAVDDKGILEKLRRVMNFNIGKNAPSIICVLSQEIHAYRGACYKVQDYSAAVENMLLTCVELGYASCWVEGYLKDDKNIGRKMADILKVPKEYELVCILPIGVAADSVREVKKKGFCERAWFNGFNENYEQQNIFDGHKYNI